MRDIKELLEILLHQYQNNPDNFIRSAGLCHATIFITVIHVIDSVEAWELRKFIYNKKPAYCSDVYLFWWQPGEIQPRIEFLKKIISEL